MQHRPSRQARGAQRAPRVFCEHQLFVTVRQSQLVVSSSLRRGHSAVLAVLERHPEEKLPSVIIFDFAVGAIFAEAMAWMRDAGITWAQLSRGEGILAVSEWVPDADALNAQLAWRASGALEITRMLLELKLHGQAANAQQLLRCPDTAKKIMIASERLALASTHRQILREEGIGAAQHYWQAWKKQVTVPFLPGDLPIAARWLSFTDRHSLASDGNRHATDAINAMLNFAYAAGETLAVRACHATGLSPVIGFSHTRAYARSRDGIIPKNQGALDILEALRPQLDALVLARLDYGQGIAPYLSWRDFRETGAGLPTGGVPSGVVRLHSQELKRSLYADIAALQDQALELAADVRRMLKVKTWKQGGRRLEEG